MSLENRFTESELLLLSNTPYAIGSAMIFAGGSGLGTIKEMIANTKSFINGAKEFPANEIITGILPNLKDFEDTKEKSKDLKVHYKEWLKSKGVDSFEKMQTAVISDAKDVADILSSKANQNEANEYKEWALSIAENVANAAKEGGFLGFGGERVSEDERAFLDKIKEALKID
jgi:hypothetical protein